jgi:hypothetical protein
VICDALCNDMIGGGILPAMEQTIRRLARRGAPTIPASGVIRIALAEDRRLDSRKMHIVEGFDLSPFNKLFFPRYEIPTGTDQLVLRSAPGDLFSFDFQSGGPFPEARAKVILAASGGCVNGVVQWNDFSLDDEGQHENCPSVGASGLAVTFHPLMKTIEPMPGDELEVCGAHDRLSLRIWAEVP